MQKAIWKGSDRFIPDLRIKVTAGTEFEIPDDVVLGGEGVVFDIVGGASFDKLVAEAKDLKVSGHTKLSTRLDLERAVADHKAEEASKAEAETAKADDTEGNE